MISSPLRFLCCSFDGCSLTVDDEWLIELVDFDMKSKFSVFRVPVGGSEVFSVFGVGDKLVLLSFSKTDFIGVRFLHQIGRASCRERVCR